MNKAEQISSVKSKILSGGDEINTLRISNVKALPSKDAPLKVVFGNGAFGGARTLAPLALSFTAEATRNEQPVDVRIYRDPWLGKGVYAESHRTERLRRVVEHHAQDEKVLIVAHSWSWPGAVELADSSHDLLKGLEGYTPTGHRGVSASLPTVPSLLRSVYEELKLIDKNAVTRSVTGANSIALAGPARMAVSHAFGESIRAFEPEVTNKVVDLRHRLALPIGIIVAKNDSFFFPPDNIQDELTSAGILINTIPATHSSAAAEAAYGANIYQLAQDLTGVA